MAGGTQAHGRNKKKCEQYAAAGTREKNKARRLAKAQKRAQRLEARTENARTEWARPGGPENPPPAVVKKNTRERTRAQKGA
jgi:hypothetical protein